MKTDLQYTTEQYEDKIKAGILRQIHTSLSELPEFMERFDRWLNEAGKSLRTRASYLQDIRLFFRFLKEAGLEEKLKSRYVSPSCLNDLPKHLLPDFLIWVSSSCSESGKKRKLASLRALSEWLKEEGFDGLPEVTMINTPKQPPVQIPELTKDHANRLCDAVKKVYEEAKAESDLPFEDNWQSTRAKKREHLLMRDLAIITLITKTTLRLSEIIALNTDDLIDSRTLRIWRKDRYVEYKVSPDTMKPVMEYVYETGAREYLGANSMNDKALFLGHTHARISAYSVQRLFKLYADSVFGQDSHITPVSFRLYNGGQTGKSGEDLAKHMGYASKDVAVRIYRRKKEN